MAVVRLLKLTDAKLCSDRLLLRLPARLPGLSLPSPSGLYKATCNTVEISFISQPVCKLKRSPTYPCGVCLGDNPRRKKKMQM